MVLVTSLSLNLSLCNLNLVVYEVLCVCVSTSIYIEHNSMTNYHNTAVVWLTVYVLLQLLLSYELVLFVV